MLLADQALAALQRLDAPALVLADAQRGAGLLQGEVGGVEIDADQLAGLVVAGRRRGQHRGQVVGPAGELQLDLTVRGHGGLSPVGGGFIASGGMGRLALDQTVRASSQLSAAA